MNSFLNNNPKKRVVSTLFLYLLIFSLGCDFESPQKWETPSWYLPLTVPLINTVYSFEGMAQDSTIIEDSLNNTLKIIFSNSIVEPGGAKPGITDEIFDFKIPKTEQLNLFSQEFSIDKQPAQSVPDASTLPPPINLPLVLISPETVTDYALGGCLTYESLADFTFDTTITIPILASFSSILDQAVLNDEPIIKALHKITVNNGKLGVTVENNLPFEVSNFSFNYSSIEYENQKRVLKEATFSNILVGAEQENTDINIDTDNTVQFGDSLEISFSMEIDKSQLTANSGECTGTLAGKDGWALTGTTPFTDDYYFSIQLQILIEAESAENIICTTNPIIIEEAINTEFPAIENIDVKGGKITAVTTTVSPDELNYIELVATNSLFAPTDIEITFSNFFDLIDDVGIPVIVGGEIANTGVETIYSDSLASKYLGVPGYPDSILQSIAVGVKVQINEIIDGPIALGESFALSISKLLISEINLAYLTAVTYDMGFDTPSSNIEGVPQGGVGLQFYDVQLILDIYTQIGIPIQLNMLLKGSKGADSVTTIINPQLNVPEINVVGDSVRTFITLNKDGQKVEWYHMDNIDGEIPDSTFFTPIDEGQSSIVDVMNFTPETLEFGGGAKINGEGFLAPNSFLWGTFTLIAPLAFIFEQPVNIIPSEPTPMEPMDPSTSQQIDSTLVEAALNVTITNSSPLGGSLSLLISDSTIYPLFLDSLITGSWENQIYNFNTTIWDTLDPPLEIDSIYFTAIDPTADTLKALEVKFFNNDSLQFFIGRMFELGFPRADSIEYHLGFANPEFPNINTSSMIIDTTRMAWIITEEPRYNIAMITFDKSPTQSGNGEFIPLTFQTTNSIGVQAYLTLTLDTGGLGRDNTSHDK